VGVGRVNEAPSERHDMTIRFRVDREAREVRRALDHVYAALRQKGYDPVSQLVGYLMSGDPTYITSHGEARKLIRSLERDRILEELLRSYLKVRGDEPA